MQLCELCQVFSDHHSIDPLKLECGHTYCKECLIEYIDNQIKSNKLTKNQLICPTQQCNYLLTDEFLLKVLPEEKYIKYCEQLFIINEIHGLSSSEKMIDCLTENCNSKWIIWKNAESSTCPICKIKYCLKCKRKFHAPLSCKEARDNYLNNKSEGSFMKDAQKLGYVQCPECLIMIEKINLCNFIKCSSEKCQEQTYFCYICGEKLIKEDHLKHFRDNNPFGNKCRVKNNEGQWVDRLAPVNVDTQNKIPCPKCKTTQKVDCEILKNFNDQLCFCKSKQCKGIWICLICNTVLTEKKIRTHFDYENNFQHNERCLIY